MPLDRQRAEFLARKYPKHYQQLLDLLKPGEDLSAAAPVLSNLRSALLGLSDRRIIIVSSGKTVLSPLVGAEIHLEHVLGARFSKGSVFDATGIRDAVLSRNELIIESRTGDYSVSFSAGGTEKDEGARWPNLILGMQDRLTTQPATSAPAASAPAPNGNFIADIERLADLHLRGLLTEAEYTAAKNRLLAQGSAEAATPSDDSSLCRQYLAKANGLLREEALSFACVNQVINLPVASSESFGRPLVPRKDLRPAIETVRQVLHQDASMAAWLGRATLRCLDRLLEDMRGTWDDALGVAIAAAGLVPGPALDPAKLAGMSNSEQEDTLGTAQCAISVFLAFERPDRGVLGDRAYYTHLFNSTSRASRIVAHEITAWACVVIGRLVNSGHAHKALWISSEFESVPTMDSAGWYPNPFDAEQIVDGFATWQRYWNRDWTDRVRFMRDGRWRETTWSMFKAPEN